MALLDPQSFPAFFLGSATPDFKWTQMECFFSFLPSFWIIPWQRHTYSLSVYPSTYISIHPSIFPSTHSCNHPPIHLSTHLVAPLILCKSLENMKLPEHTVEFLLFFIFFLSTVNQPLHTHLILTKDILFKTWLFLVQRKINASVFELVYKCSTCCSLKLHIAIVQYKNTYCTRTKMWYSRQVHAWGQINRWALCHHACTYSLYLSLSFMHTHTHTHTHTLLSCCARAIHFKDILNVH